MVYTVRVDIRRTCAKWLPTSETATTRWAYRQAVRVRMVRGRQGRGGEHRGQATAASPRWRPTGRYPVVRQGRNADPNPNPAAPVITQWRSPMIRGWVRETSCAR